jgi:uncharacterized protein YeaO (DUF488 family)
MSRIFTTYFANLSRINRSNYLVISIARYDKGLGDIHEILLAPSKDLLNDIKSGRINEEEYTERYISQLNKIGINNIVEYLKYLLIKEGKDILLVCYESPEKFCHRHILSSELNKVSDLNIEEL